MKKLFIDTNIVIDLLSRREAFYDESADLFSLADKKIIELSISSLTIANTSYILLRQIDSKSAKEILRKLRLQDIIITRNLKDFKASKLPVMTARQFLETFKPIGNQEA